MNIYEQVKKDIDKTKTQLAHAQNIRIEEAYKTIPRLQVIDDTIADLGIQFARHALNGTNIDTLKNEITALKQEKEAILLAEYSTKTLSIKHICSLCEDLGHINGTRCSCIQTKIINKYIEMSGLNKVLQKENFDYFDIRHYSSEVVKNLGISPLENIQAIYKESLNFCNTFGNNNTNLLFYGSPGLGKTFMCHCIAKDILDKGHPVLYVTAPQLAKTIEAARFNKEEHDISSLELYYTCPLLIIDDLGTEFSTIVTQAELFSIINARLLNGLNTIISTNLGVSDLKAAYSERLVSRLFGDYTSFKFIGNDIRIAKRASI